MSTDQPGADADDTSGASDRPGGAGQSPHPQQPYGQGQPYPGQPYGGQPPHGGGPGYPQYAAGGYGGPVMPRKEPALSLIVSFLIPGVGSMINGDVGKGVGILVGFLVSLVLVVVIVGIFGMVGFWIWGMVDAYQGAVAVNRRNGYPG